MKLPITRHLLREGNYFENVTPFKSMRKTRIEPRKEDKTGRDFGCTGCGLLNLTDSIRDTIKYFKTNHNDNPEIIHFSKFTLIDSHA